MEGSTKVFQVVGFKNSGKTTLIQEIVHYWKCCNLKVGTIKHHGHGGTPKNQLIENDTDKHRKAGAAITAVEGDGELLLQNVNLKWSLKDIIQMYSTFSLDLILVEGYKYEAYPKAVIIRNETDLKLLKELKNIQAVITWIPLKQTPLYTVFSIEDKPAFLKWLYSSLNT